MEARYVTGSNIPPPVGTQGERSQTAPSWLRSCQEVIYAIGLLFGYVFHMVVDFVNRGDSKKLFADKRIARAHNAGKFADIPFYARAKAHSLNISPFGDGNCYGATLKFAKEWHSGKQVEEVAQDFSNGIPKEGVFLQTYQATACDTVDALGVTINRFKFEQLMLDTIGKYAELESEAGSLAKTTFEGLVDGVTNLNEGVYYLGLPVYNFFGCFEGLHAVALVKEAGRTVLYDPNHGTGYDEDSAALMTRLAKVYGGGVTTNIGAWRRVVNFFTLSANPPLRGERDNLYLFKLNKV